MYIGLTPSAMPDVHLAWVPKGTRAPYDTSRSALIPLYVDGMNALHINFYFIFIFIFI